MKLVRFGTYLANCRGTAAIEFAIVGPIFIFFMFAMIVYGIYLGATNSVQQLAADAARVAIAGLNQEERIQLAENYIALNGGEYMLLQQEFLKVEVSDNDTDPTQFQVEVEYDAKNLPIWNLYKMIPLPGQHIKRTSTIRTGGL